MNKTEEGFFKWLLKQGYKPEDIHYQGRGTLDFVTSDGRKWEVKRLYRHKILIYPSGGTRQWDALFDDPENTEIVVMDERKEDPVLRIPIKNISKDTRLYKGIDIYLIGEKTKVDRITVTIDRDLLKEIDGIVKKHSHMGASRSSVMEYYLKKGVADDRKLREEETRGRVIV